MIQFSPLFFGDDEDDDCDAADDALRDLSPDLITNCPSFLLLFEAVVLGALHSLTCNSLPSSSAAEHR